MGKYVIVRLLQSAILLVLVTIITFLLIHAAPGGPSAVMADTRLPAAQLQRMRANLGLDQPVPVQYAKWVAALIQGDFGISYTANRPVLREIGDRLPNTLILAGTAFTAALVLSIPLGIYSARRTHTAVDTIISGATFVGLSIPVFWFGIVLIIVFSVAFHLLPSSGMYTTNQPHSFIDLIKHLIMPALVLAVPNLAVFTRFVRASVLEALSQDYVRTARAKGLTETAVTYRHVLRNALIPIITVFGLTLPVIVAGASVTETVFGWPGMGRLAVDAAFTRDYPVIMGITVLVASAVIVINLLTDLVYLLIDPRVRL
jgi:peptide/nickel transport system permease protein